MNGHDEEYDAVVAVISSNEVLPSLQYIHSILLAHEGRLEQKKSTNSEYSINYIANSKNINQERSYGNRNQSNINHRGGQSNRSRGRLNYNNRSRCQICEKYGHTANKCYFRFDTNFIPTQQGNNSLRTQNPSANLVNARPKVKIENANNEMAKIKDIQDASWYPNSGATHHMTSNLSNLNLSNKEYKGTQLLYLGNGKPIHISHTGNASIKGVRQL